MAEQPERLTKKFCGRTEGEVGGKFMDWEKETWGRVRIIEKHPMDHFGSGVTARRLGEPNLSSLTNAWSMLVEYVIVAIDDEEPKEQKKRSSPRKHR